MTKPEWAVKDARIKMSPPPMDEMLIAIEKANQSDDAVDWVVMQFQIFLEISRQRGRGQTAQPITFAELLAYQDLNNLEFHPIELNNLLSMDSVFLDVVSQMADAEISEARLKAGA